MNQVIETLEWKKYFIIFLEGLEKQVRRVEKDFSQSARNNERCEGTWWRRVWRGAKQEKVWKKEVDP